MSDLTSNKRALSDDDRMPIGKWKDRRLGEIPDHYWRWFIQQDWSNKYPDLLEYGQIVEES